MKKNLLFYFPSTDCVYDMPVVKPTGTDVVSGTDTQYSDALLLAQHGHYAE